MATEQHVIPTDDGYDHDFEDCVCVPKVSVTADGPIYMHNALVKSGRYQIVDVVEEAPGVSAEGDGQ